MTEENLPLETSVSQVRRWLDSQQDFVLLDCRETMERNLAKIEPSQFVPMTEMMQRLPELEQFKDKHVVIYCHHGGRSFQVAAWLRQRGFESAQSMTGGIEAWSLEVDPRIPRY